MFKKEQSKFERYQDATGEFSNTRLKFSEWYIRHKILLRKIVIWILSLWGIITIVLGIYIWGRYFLFDYVQDEQQVAQMSKNLVSSFQIQNHAPQTLNIGNQWVFNSANKKYDFAIEVSNTNKRWIADITYVFLYNNRKTDIQHTQILPGQKQFVVSFGEESPRHPSATSFKIINTTWKRINPHDIFDPIRFMKQRLIFHTDNVDFIPANRTNGSDFYQISFDISNNSLFSYWNASFIVVYKRNGKITGLSPLFLKEFVSGDSHRIDNNLYMDRLDVDSVEIQPMINVFDNSVYMPR